MVDYPKSVRIVEVGPRDGLQNESKELDAKTVADFVNKLIAAGLTSVEGGSLVSPKWVPQMRHTKEVYPLIDKPAGVSIPVLVPNMQGLKDAIDLGVREIAVFAAASETFSKKNINKSIAESLEAYREVVTEAKKHGMKVRGYVSCVLGCPYEGEIEPAAVAKVAKELHDMGCYEVSLGDTIGKGTPVKTREMLAAVKEVVPVENLAVHFHDTYGQALVNILVALEEGISVVDSAAGGLGGCPYAKGASGNVATEEVLYMLHGMGIKTGVDLEKVAEAGRFITDALNRPLVSKVGQVFQKEQSCSVCRIG